MFANQLDCLYPEWDEFYLLVCDICGIVIRPQALEKHLATKHRINVQPTTHNDSLPINHKTPSPDTGTSNASNTSKNDTVMPTNGFFDPTFCGLQSPAPTSSMINQPSSPSPSTTSRYRDRKWRNIYNVLKDAFF